MKKKKNNNDSIVTFGVLMVVMGIIILSYNYFLEKKTKAFETISFDLFDDFVEVDDPSVDVPPEPSGDPDPGASSGGNDSDVTDPEPPVDPGNDGGGNNGGNGGNNKPAPSYAYIGTLEIPKINLKKGFVDINSPDNNISENVTIIHPSTYPDVESGNFILAAHSGNMYISFFKNLYKLGIDDVAYVYYNNVKYTYKIVNIYTQAKTGTIGIYRDYKKTSLTLITCSKDDKTTQTIYIAELISKE